MTNKNKKIIGISTGIFAILIIIYIILCFIAQGKDFLVNTTINDIDVGSMSKQEAILALNDQYQKDINDPTIKLSFHKKTYTLDLKDNITFDSQKYVNQISKEENSFLLSGYQYLFHHNHIIPIEIKDSKVLDEKIKATHISDYDTSKPTTYKLKKDKIIFTKGIDGKKVTIKSVNQDIKNALQDYKIKQTINCTIITQSINDDEIKTIHDSLSKKSQNATLDKNNNYQIIPSQDHVKFDLDKAIQLYDQTSQGSSFSLKAVIKQAQISTDTLKKNLFKDLLGEYTTYVSGSSVRRNNVALAGKKCNVILLPGEEFSYNDTVGKRTKENGFGEAGAYLNGETVQEVGGGVCQASSTLYNSVLLANLKIIERTNHTYISSYVPIGRDATVSWGGPDFKFKNDQKYPIKIEVTYANSRLTSRIYGTNETGIHVEITSKRTATISYSTSYQNDPSLPEGKTQTKQSGSNGAKAVSYRYVYDKNNQLISNQLEANSVYKPHNAIVIRGTKKVEQPTPQPTTPVAPTTPTTPTTPPETTPTTPVQ